MNTTQRRDAAPYLLKAIAAAANDDNQPAAEALMALYEVLKQPVPPCELPEIVRKSLLPAESPVADEPDANPLFFECLVKRYDVSVSKTESAKIYRFEYDSHLWEIKGFKNHVWPKQGYLLANPSDYRIVADGVQKSAVFKFSAGAGVEYMQAIGVPVSNMEEAEDAPPKPRFEHEGKFYDVDIKETVFNKELRFFWGLHHWKSDKLRDFEWPKGNVKLVDYDLQPIPGTVHSVGGFIFDSDESIGFVEIKAMGTSVAKEPSND